MNKVFLDSLPKKDGIGALKGRSVIDWINSIGYKVKFIYKDIGGEVEITKFDKRSRKLSLKYKDIEEFNISAAGFSKCSLGKLLGKYTVDFKIEIGVNLKDNRRDLTITEREYRQRVHTNGMSIINDKWYKHTCNKCGWTEGWIIENALLNGIGCSCCCASPQILVQGINDIPTTDPWMVKYFQDGCEEAKLYTRASGKKIYAICPDCGEIRKNPISIHQIYCNKSISCPCGDGQSYPNKFMYSLLKQLNIIFKSEYSPEWIKPRRFDFYIPSKKIIIEMDGEFHFRDNGMNGITAEESQKIDTGKDRKAFEHEIYVIRINSKFSKLKSIKDNILESKLSEIFNLSNIDWLKCEEFALNNLIRKVYDLKRNDPQITTQQLVSIMDLSNVTILKYLKKGKTVWG